MSGKVRTEDRYDRIGILHARSIGGCRDWAVKRWADAEEGGVAAAGSGSQVPICCLVEILHTGGETSL